MLVTEQERKWVAENAIQKIDGLLNPVIDIDKAARHMMQERDKKGASYRIEILPISFNKLKEPNYNFSYAMDSQFGVMWGIFQELDEMKSPVWQRINLSDSQTFDLRRVSDQRMWCVLRMFSRIQGSPFEKSPLYYVKDPVAEAQQVIDEISSMRKAFARIDKIDGRDLIYFARFMGLAIEDLTREEYVRNKLMDSARKNPVDFNKKWDDPMRGYAEVFASAYRNSIIVNIPEKGFYFGEIFLGTDENETTRTISEDNTVLSSLRKRLGDEDEYLKDILEKKKADEKKSAGKGKTSQGGNKGQGNSSGPKKEDEMELT